MSIISLKLKKKKNGNTNLEASGVLKKPREILRLSKDSWDGVCCNSPVLWVPILCMFSGLTKFAQ